MDTADHKKSKTRSIRKVFCFLLFLSLGHTCCYGQSLQQKRSIANLFPVSPYNVSIDSLLHFYTSNPDFMIDSAAGETETHFFYLLGDYHTTMLFGPPPLLVKIELEAKKPQIFTYEVIGWFDSTQHKEVEKEFTRLYKQLGSIFHKSVPAIVQKKAPLAPQVYNFYWDKDSRSPDFFLAKDSALVNGRLCFYINLCLNLTLSE